MVRGRVVSVLMVLAVLLGSLWSVVRFALEGANTPAAVDVEAAASWLRQQHLGDDDVVLVAPPWSMAPLRALATAARVVVAADGPWDVLHQRRHTRTFLWTEPDSEPWLADRTHDVLGPTAQHHRFGVIDVAAVSAPPARADLKGRFADATIGLVDANGTVTPCTQLSRGIGGGVRCAGQPRAVRVAREWSQVTENGADVMVVHPAAAPQALRLTWDGVAMGSSLVVAAGHTRQALGRLPVGTGTITIAVFVDDERVAVLERRPSFIVEPHRRSLVERFVGGRPLQSGFIVDVVDTAHFAASIHRVTLEVKTDHADDNACGIDAFVPGGP